MNIYRGDIYYIESAKYFGGEQQSGTGSRPAIIVSNDTCNLHSDECSVVYLTRSDDAPHIPTHVPVICKLPSIAKCETVCRINQNRIREFIRTCTAAEMQAIDNALMIQLGIEPSLATEADIEALKADCEKAREALELSEKERSKLVGELEKRAEACEDLAVKREAVEAEYRRLAEELDEAKTMIAAAAEAGERQKRESLTLEGELSKAFRDVYELERANEVAAKTNIELREECDTLREKLEEYSICETAKIRELQSVIDQMAVEKKQISEEAEVMLDIEKNNVRLYMAQLDAQVAANDHLQGLLNEAQEKLDVMTAEIEDDKSADDMTADIQRQLEQVQYIETQNENIRLKAEIDVYKQLLDRFLPSPV